VRPRWGSCREATEGVEAPGRWRSGLQPRPALWATSPGGEDLPLLLLAGLLEAHQAFLGHGGDQGSVLGEDRGPGQAAAGAGPGAFHGVEMPVVEVDRPVEPHGVVEAGHLQAGLLPADVVG